MKDICKLCGATEDLVEHHTSYIPERTEVLCRKCDAKARRHLPSGGLIPIFKAYPPRGMVYIPQDILKQLGELIAFYPAPISPVGILFPYKMPLTDVEQVLKVILQDIRLRMGKNEAIP